MLNWHGFDLAQSAFTASALKLSTSVPQSVLSTSSAASSTIMDCGISASDINYANLYKQGSQIAFAHANGVDMMTLDSEDE